ASSPLRRASPSPPPLRCLPSSSAPKRRGQQLRLLPTHPDRRTDRQRAGSAPPASIETL
ncbi:MAG: hypothetical protein AVDCRST_MAG45-632, partial [uncultured Solirubrobacterales bacterium]